MIITKVATVDKYVSVASRNVSYFNSVVTIVGFKLLTLVVRNGDNIDVVASIKQILIGQALGIRFGGS
jgi:hypothetical protein